MRSRWTLALLIAALAFGSPAGRGLAHDGGPGAGAPAQRAAAEDLTTRLLAAYARYEQAGPAQRAQALGALRAAAASRKQLLAALVDTDPGEVLRLAVPGRLRAALPVAVQGDIEEEVQLEGDLEVLHEDGPSGGRYHYTLHAGGRRYSLHFAADAPALPTGTRVRARGVRVDGALALTSGTTSVQTLSAPAPNTFGVQRTLVILVNFADNPTQPYTPATAASVVFGTTSSFDLEGSFGQTSLAGDVAGWYTIPLSATVCDYGTLASQANQAAAAAGFALSNYTRRVYGFPKNACAWWGLGSIGGNPSSAWINGSLQLRVVGHEMGHNFGLYHSHALECGAAVTGGGCSSLDYGDVFDIMGATAGHFNAFQKERLGWLAYGISPPITTVTMAATYPLEAYALNPPLGGAKALKILKSTDSSGARTYYYVEYRQPIGFDSYLTGNASVVNGVVIRLGTEGRGDTSYLLDLTPATSSWNDAPLVLGQTFTDSDAGVSIAPVSMDGTTALVTVSVAPVACTHANPAVGLSPSQSQWVAAGTTVTYTVTVTNNDSSGCVAAPFALSATVPAGWSPAVFGAGTLTVAPGASASTTMKVTSPAGTPDGIFSIPVNAVHGGASGFWGQATATYVVVSALNVTAATDKPTYGKNQFVFTRATVKIGGTPAAGVSVAFKLTKPSGVVANASAVTGSDGTATFKYRVSRKDPTGTYTVGATASMNNVSGSAATSFTVQ